MGRLATKQLQVMDDRCEIEIGVAPGSPRLVVCGKEEVAGSRLGRRSTKLEFSELSFEHFYDNSVAR
jgi:hypothetical protein